MERSWYWRLLLIVGLLGLGIFYVAPSALYFGAEPDVRRSKEALKKLIPEWLPKSRANLGIDLQGGLHLVMGVDTEKAVQDRADRAGDEIIEAMKDKDQALERVTRPGDAPVLEITMKDEKQWGALKEILEEQGERWEQRSRSGRVVSFAIKEDYETTLRTDAVDQALKTLRRRIDKYGVTEPEVRKRGTSSVMIQIAGLTADQERSVKEDIIGKTAQLEFKIVDDQNTYFADIGGKSDKPESIEVTSEAYQGPNDALVTRNFLQSRDRQALEAFVTKYPPPSDRVVRYQEIKGKNEEKGMWQTWLLERRTPLTGDALVDAFVSFDSDERMYNVAMKFDRRGAVAFEKLTGENVKRKMAIVLDDTVDSAPVIQGRIPNGNARITLGGFKSQEEILADAKALSIVLKAGALPAPVYPQEERTVGATLGDDAVEKGKAAVSFALVFIVFLMVVYYKLSGVIGVIALSMNILFLFATLSAFGATLTLPGIAGLALTVGMAVDANIIQFERIREELSGGKNARAAVDAGFDKAFSAIFDANVTTLLAAIVLYQYGSGPIRGFATTLGIGVVINTFTAVVVPRLFLDYLTRGRRVQQLSI